MSFIGILFFFFSLFILARALTVLLHEFGHAVPLLLFSNSKVTLFIGSYGDKTNTLHLPLGRLDLYLKYDRIWQRGLCLQGEDASITVVLLSIVAGPLVSFLISTIGCYLVFAFEFHGFLKLFFVCLAISGVIDLFQNLFSSNAKIKTDRGSYVKNDGSQIQYLWRAREALGTLDSVRKLLEDKKYQEAVLTLDEVIDKTGSNEHILRLLIVSHLHNRNLEEALFRFQELEKVSQPTAYDHNLHGLIHLNAGRYEEGLSCFEKTISIEPQVPEYLNNRGYLYSILKDYELALKDLNLAIKLEPDFAYPYNNRAYIFIKKGLYDEALSDLIETLKLDSSNAYAYRNYGIYYMALDDTEMALEYFKKAKELMSDVLWIDELLEETRGRRREKNEVINKR